MIRRSVRVAVRRGEDCELDSRQAPRHPEVFFMSPNRAERH
jgi:hypothetical protein